MEDGKMKVKNKFYETGIAEIKKLGDMDLPATVSFQIVKGFKKLEEMSKIYLETKQKLLAKYGKLSEDGTQYTFGPKELPLFQKEMDDLLNIESDIPFVKVTLPKDVKVSAKFLMILEQFVDVEK